MIFDTHCHLNEERLLANIDEILSNAQKAGIKKIIVPGWDYESSLIAINLAQRHDFIYAAIGYHPSDVGKITDESFASLFENASNPKVVAIGEIGLDYYWDKDPTVRENQKKWFAKQIEVANKFKLPICIHNRDAFEDTIKVLKEHRPLYGGVFHCYSGSVESLKELEKLGLHIGLGGTLTFKNSRVPKEVCSAVSLDMVLTETDSPYLAPHPLRGTINEPKNTVLVVDEIARIKQMSYADVSQITYRNALKVFGIKE